MDDEKVIPATEAAEPFEATSLDKALTELNKPEEPVAAAPAATPAAEPAKPGAEPAKPGEVKPGEPAKPADAVSEPFKVGEEAKFKISDVAVKTKEEIEKLPYFNDATFQQFHKEFADLSQFKVGMSQALNEVPSAGKYTIPDAETMKAVVADAFNLYDVINLKASPIDLLELAAKNYGEESINQVIAQILLYAEEKGITKENYSDLSKPENKRLFELSKESRERKTAESNARTTEQQAERQKQMEGDFDAVEKFVNDWAEKNSVHKDDALDYLTYVTAQIGGDAKQLEMIRGRKFGEIERALTEYNNRMVTRQKRWEDAQIEKKQKRNDKLQGAGTPQGGAPPPAEPPKKKINFNDDDERLDAVSKALRE